MAHLVRTGTDMKIRWGIFFAASLLLPWLASALNGEHWGDDAAPTALSPVALLLTAMLLLAYAALMNRLSVRRRGANLLTMPRRFQLWLLGSSLALGWLGVWLNHHADNGFAPLLDGATQFAASLLFFALVPAILATRAWLVTYPGLLRSTSRHLPVLPSLKPEPTALFLMTLALVGFMAGPARPHLLWPLLWSAPLWLLFALQLLWHENTLCSGLPRGDWQRPIIAALSGLLVGALLYGSHAASGGGTTLPPASAWAGFALFGLLTAQLNELIASDWRGKSAHRTRKAFPLPVVVKQTASCQNKTRPE
jgi:hypothetical protein